MDATMIALYTMTLKDVDNLTLAHLNNHINGWGKVNPKSSVFAKALELDIVKADGMPVNEYVAQALTLVGTTQGWQHADMDARGCRSYQGMAQPAQAC